MTEMKRCVFGSGGFEETQSIYAPQQQVIYKQQDLKIYS